MTNWITGIPDIKAVAEQEKNGGWWLVQSRGYLRSMRLHIADSEIWAEESTLSSFLFVATAGWKSCRYLPVTSSGLPLDYEALRKVADAAELVGGADWGTSISEFHHFRRIVFMDQLRTALTELKALRGHCPDYEAK